jgi:AraC family transcriptional regulator
MPIARDMNSPSFRLPTRIPVWPGAPFPEAWTALLSKDAGSRIPFGQGGARKAPVRPLAHATLHATSSGLGWQGLHAEAGQNAGWSVDDLVVRGHYLAVNRAAEALVIERRTPAGFRREVIPPGTLWVQPAGTPFSFRVAQTSVWGAVVVDPERIRSLTGALPAIEPGFGVADPALVALVQALLAETFAGGTAGRLFADGMATALAAQLLRRHGRAEPGQRGGLPGHKLRLLRDFVEQRLEHPIGVDELAGLAGLSPFHFSRAFRQSTGSTPYRFVMDRRLDRARDLLQRPGTTVAAVAAACGFADQAHLARLFRQRFGIAPSRARRGVPQQDPADAAASFKPAGAPPA